MKLGSPFIEQVRDRDGFIAESIKRLQVSIETAFHREHNVDDTHGTINATGAISERKRTTPMGVWIDVPFSQTTFSTSGAGGITVTSGDYNGYYYTLIGSTMIVAFEFRTITVTAPTGVRLSFTIPANMYAKRVINGTFTFLDNGVAGSGLCRSTVNGRTIDCFVSEAVPAWTASANNTALVGQLAFEVNV